MDGIIWYIIVGLVAGWLAGLIVKGGGFGIIGDIVVGIIGAVIGGMLMGQSGNLVGAILVATVGAVILIFLLRLIKRA